MDPATWGTLAAVAVTASLPFYLYGAAIVLYADVVTWDVLVYHLQVVGTGLVLTTVPVAGWMVPRLLGGQFGGLAVLHAFFGLQAYALLTFALTGIVRIFQVKWTHDLYRDPDPERDLNDLHENMADWRRRLRVGVAGYVACWVVAWVIGMVRYVNLYDVPVV
ncbi:MAG: hypothetical protein ABEJ42_02650 [Halobacteriaceae archaeon]